MEIKESDLKILGFKPLSEIELPETLYKYRNWADDFHKTIITDQIVYFSSPEGFTDEYDCRIPIRYDLLSETDLYWKFYNHSLRDRPGKPAYMHQSYANYWVRNTPMKEKSYREKMQKEFFQNFFQHFGILSLTANPNNLQMWQEYSDNSKGFCIGFDPIILFKQVGGGMKVKYYDDLPIIYPEPKHSIDLQHIIQTFFKNRKYDFEQEYRAEKFSPTPFTIEQRKLVVSPEAYKEIIIGKNMPASMVVDIQNCIPSELSHIIIKDQE